MRPGRFARILDSLENTMELTMAHLQELASLLEPARVVLEDEPEGSVDRDGWRHGPPPESESTEREEVIGHKHPRRMQWARGEQAPRRKKQWQLNSKRT